MPLHYDSFRRPRRHLFIKASTPPCACTPTAGPAAQAAENADLRGAMCQTRCRAAAAGTPRSALRCARHEHFRRGCRHEFRHYRYRNYDGLGARTLDVRYAIHAAMRRARARMAARCARGRRP